MENPYKLFQSSCEGAQSKVSIILVRPEEPGNVGSVARAMSNMGVNGKLHIVGSPHIINEESQKFAKHAKDRLETAAFWVSLEDCLNGIRKENSSLPILSLAATARIGSAKRPHPIRVREAMHRAMNKLASNELSHIALVFGPEGSGLNNEDIALCDWVVTIPSLVQYRSLNLAQSVLIFCYEANMALLESWDEVKSSKPSSKEKLVRNLLQVAEEVGFILPNDPFKMRPRLEGLFSQLPNHIKDTKTLHGLLDQVRRSVRKGEADFKGRYRRTFLKEQENGTGQI